MSFPLVCCAVVGMLLLVLFILTPTKAEEERNEYMKHKKKLDE